MAKKKKRPAKKPKRPDRSAPAPPPVPPPPPPPPPPGAVALSSPGDDERERKAGQSRDRAKSVREIGPLPQIVDPARREKGRKSLRAFLQLYFPRRFRLAFSSAHLIAIDRMESCTDSGELFACAMPRGFGKTTMAECAVLRAVLYGFRRFVVLVCATGRLAERRLKQIMRELETNDLLLADFPEACYPTEGFGGAVLDYGTWPRQSRTMFSADDMRPGMAEQYPTLGVAERLYKGLTDLSAEVLGREYVQERTGGRMRVERCLVDSGWQPQTVYAWCRQTPHWGVMMDHIPYRADCTIIRDQLRRVALDRVFRAWAREAVLVPGYLPKGLPPVAAWSMRWQWDGTPSIDPVKDANADDIGLKNGSKNLSDVLSDRGVDWEDHLRQRAREIALARTLETEFGLAPGTLYPIEPMSNAPVPVVPEPEWDNAQPSAAAQGRERGPSRVAPDHGRGYGRASARGRVREP